MEETQALVHVELTALTKQGKKDADQLICWLLPIPQVSVGSTVRIVGQGNKQWRVNSVYDTVTVGDLLQKGFSLNNIPVHTASIV